MRLSGDWRRVGTGVEVEVSSGSKALAHPRRVPETIDIKICTDPHTPSVNHLVVDPDSLRLRFLNNPLVTDFPRVPRKVVVASDSTHGSCDT